MALEGVEPLASLAREGRELVRLVLLADLPLESLSNTLEFPPLTPLRGSLDLDNLSIREFLRVTGFFKSLSE